MLLRIFLSLAALCLCLSTSLGKTKAIVKANVLRGESFVTIDTDPKEVETIVSEVLANKGFEILTSVQIQEAILFVDVFVYQFYSQYPAITLTVRTKSGIHFLAQDYTKIFADRNATNLKMASKLAEQVPLVIDKSMYYQIRLGSIFTPNKTTDEAITKLSKVKYFSMIHWKDDSPAPFIIPAELNLFMLYASNFVGMKKQLQHGPITIRLKINSAARFELDDINSSIPLEERQRIQIQEFIDSFPMWITEGEVKDIEITYGVSTR